MLKIYHNSVLQYYILKNRQKLENFGTKQKVVKQVQRFHCGICMYHAENFRTTKSTVAKFINEETGSCLYRGRNSGKSSMLKKLMTFCQNKPLRKLSSKKKHCQSMNGFILW